MMMVWLLLVASVILPSGNKVVFGGYVDLTTRGT